MFITSDHEIVDKDCVNLVFELIMEVKSSASDGAINEFAAGWCSVPLVNMKDPKTR